MTRDARLALAEYQGQVFNVEFARRQQEQNPQPRGLGGGLECPDKFFGFEIGWLIHVSIHIKICLCVKRIVKVAIIYVLDPSSEMPHILGRPIMKRPIASLYQFFEVFPDEQSVIDHLGAIRWRDGAYCPHCNSKRVMHFSDMKTHKCHDCRQRFSIKVGTIFEDTKLPLRKWFAAIWLITFHKKGIASTQLAKDLQITQKSAWFVLHRLRYAAKTKSFNAPLSGAVELDETLFAGKESNKHKNKRVWAGTGPHQRD